MRLTFPEIARSAMDYARRHPEAEWTVNNEAPAWPLERCLQWLEEDGEAADSLDASLPDTAGEGFTWVLA